jgi:hypothetical protein
MKKIKWIIGSLVTVLVIALVIVWLSINSIVRNQIETQASSSLNLKTTLGSAHVSILGGSLGLNDLAVASPEGFTAPRMFGLEGAKVGVSLGNLRSDPVAIDRIVIDQPRVIVEQANGKFNFRALMDRPSEPTPEGSQPVKLIIRELTINDARVVLRPGIPGLGTEVTIPIPSFTVKDVGTGEGNQNGAAIKEVVLLVVTRLVDQAADSGSLPEGVKALLELDAKAIGQQIRGEIDKQIENVRQDVTKEVEKGIGNLLNRGNQKQD